MSLNESEWFTEVFDGDSAIGVRYSRKLFDETGEFQRIEIFDSPVMGKILILGGCFMVTEHDHFVYHEMIVHPAMQVLKNPRKAIVIGGGDGGCVTELVKYPGLTSVILCEIDPGVVAACREFFPEVSAGLKDPRVTVVNQDGAAFIRDFKEEIDLVIVDSTDPVGPGKALFEVSFFESIKRSLTKSGVAVFQSESPFYMANTFQATVADLRAVFGRGSATPYVATIPSYPGGLWSFTFCSEAHDPVAEAPGGLPAELADTLRYYDSGMHRAAFSLPVFVRRLLEKA